MAYAVRFHWPVSLCADVAFHHGSTLCVFPRECAAKDAFLQHVHEAGARSGVQRSAPRRPGVCGSTTLTGKAIE